MECVRRSSRPCGACGKVVFALEGVALELWERRLAGCGLSMGFSTGRALQPLG